MSGSEPINTDRLEGKGDNRDDDDDDPADEFEDDPESDAADDAQQTVEEIEEIIESITEDEEATSEPESQTESTQGSSGGGTIESTGENSSGESLTEQYEPGRYGLASNREVLKNTFEASDNYEYARDKGIENGNTTADDMWIVELEDGSKVYATETDAYPTRMVESKQQAINNHLRSPKIIESLGGGACKAEVTEGPAGVEYIAKEGVEGELVKNTNKTIPTDEFEKTVSAAYFAGNSDLHGANVIVSDDGRVVIIDHDSGGSGGAGQKDIRHYEKGGHMRLKKPDDANIRKRIYDLSVEIQSGEREIPVGEDTTHYEYAHNAAKKGVRAASIDPSYDLPDGMTPGEISSAPSGYESATDYSPGTKLSVVNQDGEIIDAEVVSIHESRDKISVEEVDSGFGANETFEIKQFRRVVGVA